MNQTIWGHENRRVGVKDEKEIRLMKLRVREGRTGETAKKGRIKKNSEKKEQ